MLGTLRSMPQNLVDALLVRLRDALNKLVAKVRARLDTVKRRPRG